MVRLFSEIKKLNTPSFSKNLDFVFGIVIFLSFKSLSCNKSLNNLGL